MSYLSHPLTYEGRQYYLRARALVNEAMRTVQRGQPYPYVLVEKAEFFLVHAERVCKNAYAESGEPTPQTTAIYARDLAGIKIGLLELMVLKSGFELAHESYLVARTYLRELDECNTICLDFLKTNSDPSFKQAVDNHLLAAQSHRITLSSAFGRCCSMAQDSLHELSSLLKELAQVLGEETLEGVMRSKAWLSFGHLSEKVGLIYVHLVVASNPPLERKLALVNSAHQHFCNARAGFEAWGGAYDKDRLDVDILMILKDIALMQNHSMYHRQLLAFAWEYELESRFEKLEQPEPWLALMDCFLDATSSIKRIDLTDYYAKKVIIAFDSLTDEQKQAFQSTYDKASNLREKLKESLREERSKTMFVSNGDFRFMSSSAQQERQHPESSSSSSQRSFGGLNGSR